MTVKFGRTESERVKKAREKSFGFLQKKNAEEVPLLYRRRSSSLSIPLSL